MQADVRYGRERKSDNDNNVDVQNPKGGYAMYLKKKRGWDLACGWNMGTREMNESDGKQDVDAMQEKGTRRYRERGLWPRIWPMRRWGSEMQKWGF